MQAVHETPHGDLTGHATDGSPCPCQPSAEAVKDLYGMRWVFVHQGFPDEEARR